MCRRVLTIYHLPLLVQPAARRVVPTLQHHMVALQAAGEVVPGRGDHGVFALQVLDDLFGGSLGKLELVNLISNRTQRSNQGG